MSAEALEHEQAYLDVLYARLDVLRERTAAQLATVRRTRASGSPQNRSERDAFALLHERRLVELRAVEDRLAFGRLDLTGGARRYIGRLGLSDDDQHQLLVDWRAPAARSFYQATPAAPADVVRRRHLVTRARTVVGVEDEALDLDSLRNGKHGRLTLNGEGALLAAVSAARTGRMSDIVATIQAEQDRVIRSDLPGVLVVQGGPGTGKTAVALHRAAYLLYTHRTRLDRSGVLLVGPNELFLRYIGQVLPSLGETGVVLSTPAELFPGITANGEDDPRVATVKGDVRMADVLSAAVRERQRVPDRVLRLEVDGYHLELQPGAVAATRASARRSRKPHNLARRGFLLDLLDHLARQLARALHTKLTEENRDELIAELRDSPDVRRELNLAWMPLTPQQLLGDLYADPARLAAAAPWLSAGERALLRREKGARWTPADVALLDEAAELLGEDDTSARLASYQRALGRQVEVDYAREVLEMSGGSGPLTAELLADRFEDDGPPVPVSERAAHDRTWAYGHVVVDEAQELSPMMWRLLMRRCPSRSMTLVGDIAQTGSPAGAGSWAQVLDPYVAGRWRLAELTVNYRTPAQIMALAADVLAAAGITARTPDSVREGAWPPVAQRIEGGDAGVRGDNVAGVGNGTEGRAVTLTRAVAGAVRTELAALDPDLAADAGRLAVITPHASRSLVRAALAEALPTALATGTAGASAESSADLDARVVVLTVAEAKGLEFDAVVLVEPADILAESPRGANDLYVALSRPTQRLLVIYSVMLPAGFKRVESRS